MAAIYKNEIFGLLARIALGILFVWASVDKILHPAAFAEIINNYQLLPGELINVFALILPWLELFCGLGLILGILIRPSAAWTALMLVMFIGAVSLALSKGINIDCGCFSTSANARTLGLTLILQDIGLLLLAVLAWTAQSRLLSVCNFSKQKS